VPVKVVRECAKVVLRMCVRQEKVGALFVCDLRSCTLLGGKRVLIFTRTHCKLLVLQCWYSTYSKANILFNIYIV